VDGECVPADSQVPEDNCGPNAELVDGKCQGVGGSLTCGGQTAPVEDPDNPGSFICLAEDDCSLDLVCPEPTGNGFTICGRIFNIADNMPVWRTPSDSSDTSQCGEGDTTAPCNFFVELYNLNGDQLASEPTYLDACGRFRFENVTPVQQFPFGGVLVYEPGMSMVPSGMNRPPTSTGNFLPTTSAGLGGAQAMTIDKATYDAWRSATSNNLDIDTTGAVLLYFLDKFAPVANVVAMQFKPADVLGNPNCDFMTGMCMDLEPYGPGGTAGSEEIYYFDMGLPSGSAMTTSAMDPRALLTNHTPASIAPSDYTNLWGGKADMSPATTDCNGNASGFGIFMPFPAPTFAQQGALAVFPIPTINPDAAPNVELCQ